jgi:Na+-translocating ferredoxin:NAD+ oxidoreductase RnfG subunit
VVRESCPVRLGGTALVVAALLGLFHAVSRAAADSPGAAEEAARRAVLPEAGCGVFVRSVFAAGEADTLVYHKAYRNPDSTGLVGYIVQTRARGYSGSIETVAGVGLDGRLRAIRVISHKETPGSGAKIAEVRPAKTFVDALKACAGKTGSGKIVVEYGGATGSRLCMEVEIKDTTICSDLDRAVVDRDTAAILAAAPKALAVDERHKTLLESRGSTVEIAENLVRKIRNDPTPWWLAQFEGKAADALVLTKQKTPASIQGITGATVSTRAVTESVRNAIVRLEQALGGFEETKK